MKKLFLLISSVIVLVFFSACEDEQATTIVEDNKSFNELKAQSNKNYKLTTTDGKIISFKAENQTLTSKDLEGKYVLFNFWATWCAPCIREMPTLVKFHEKYKDKFIVIGVLMENKDPKELAVFMEKFKIKFPVTVGKENYRMAKAFDDVKMYPESFLYSPDGKFMKKFIGEISASKLEKILNK